MTENILNLPPTAQHTVDAGLIALLTATFFDWLPKATALLIFIYYTLQIITMVQVQISKRRSKNRRATDVEERTDL